MKSKEQFAQHVTGTSFSLTLSKRMIDALAFCDHVKPLTEFMQMRNFSALCERGLLEFKNPGWEISEAGRHVISLLKLAGLYPDPFGCHPPVEIGEPEVAMKNPLNPLFASEQQSTELENNKEVRE